VAQRKYSTINIERYRAKQVEGWRLEAKARGRLKK
jgi:hypothetical protein